ncbi:MAG: histidine kinase [Anaerolineae bacterium]|nr:histidine kinase [Anaerolineae bacterium]
MRTRWFSTMRARVLAVVLLTMLPAFALLFFNAADERERALGVTREGALSTVRLIATQQSQLIRSTRQMMQLIAQAEGVREGDPVACNRALNSIYAVTQGYRGFSVARPNGDVFCVAPPRDLGQPLNTAHRSYFQKVAETGRFAIGDFQIGAVTGTPNVSFGYPITDTAGSLTGVVWAAWSIDRINDLASTWRLPEGSSVLVMDSLGTVVTRYPQWEDWVGQSFRESELFQRMLAQPEGTERLPGLDGVARWFAFSRVSSSPLGTAPGDESYLYVAAGLSDESFIRSVNNRLLLNLLTLTLISALGLIMAYGLTEWMIGRRARRMSETTRQLQLGNWSARTGMTADEGELGALGQTVDEMADALQERDRALQTVNAELEERVAFRTAELAAANAQLMASQDQLRRLSRELLEVAEEERIRLANDVGDEIGQGLTSIKMDVVLAQRHIAEGKIADAKHHLVAAVRHLDSLVQSAREIAGDLRPSVLDDFGLTAAAEGQLAEFERQTGSATRLRAKVDESKLTSAVSTAAFRVLQEALRNVAQHAHASEVDVELFTVDGQLVLEVRDNGQGFTPGDLTKPQSIGVLGMRERALQLGGTVEVVGAPGHGATLTLVLPVAAWETVGTVAND